MVYKNLSKTLRDPNNRTKYHTIITKYHEVLTLTKIRNIGNNLKTTPSKINVKQLKKKLIVTLKKVYSPQGL